MLRGTRNGPASAVKKRPAFDVELVRLEVLRPSLHQGFPAASLQRDLQSFHNRARYLVLNCKGISPLPVITLRPQMESVGCVDKLRRDAQVAPGSAHTSFKNSSHAQLFSDKTRVDVFSFEGKRGTTRHNVKLRNLCQRIDDLLGDAVCKKFVLRSRAHADERKHCDGITCGACRRTGSLVGSAYRC